MMENDGMICFVCHRPVPDQGDTLPKSIHIGCVAAWMDELRQAERAAFATSIPVRRATTMQFRRWAPLKLATQSEPEALD